MFLATIVLFFLFVGLTQGKDKDVLARNVKETNHKRVLAMMNSADRTKVGLSIAIIVICAACLLVGVTMDWPEDIFYTGRSYCFIVSCICIPTASFVLLANIGRSSENEAILQKRLDQLKRFQKAQETELAELVSTYGQAQKVFEIGATPKGHFIVFPDTRTLWCQGTPLPYGSLKGYSMFDDSKLETTSRVESVTTPDAGELVGGALLGKAIAGDAGAVVGAMSAGSQTVSVGTHSTREVHRWTIALKTDSIDNPVVYLDCGYNSSRVATEISAILDIILGK